jgi:hypothetical protein
MNNMSQQKDPTLLEIPGVEGLGVDFLKNLLNANPPLQTTPAAMQVPLQQVAGMGTNEQTVQDLLSKYLGTTATGGEAYKLGMGELSKTLGGEFYNPQTSDFWKGYRETSEMEQAKGVSDVRRRGQLGGGLYAEPNQRTEAEYVKGMGAERLTQLGGLYENERNRASNAVNQALGYAGLEEQGAASRIGLGAEVGAIPRNIQNQQYQAAYNQASGQAQSNYNTAQQASQNAYNQQLFPYTAQAGIAQTLLPNWYIPGQDNTGAGMLGLLGSVIGALGSK